MTEHLDLHRANPDELAQAFRNVHDVWPSAPDPEEHTRRRLADPRYKNATSYVGTLDGRVVTACNCFHVSVSIDGTVERACAIGAVHTPAEFRGRGFAPRLLAFAESQERAVGKTFSLLYSDIGPAYYERLGYRPCPAKQGWADLSSAPRDLPEPCILRRIDALEVIPELSEIYDRAHAGLALSIARSSEYWRYLITQRLEDEFYFAERAGKRVGYLRVVNRPHGLLLRDLAIVDETEQVERGLYAAVIGLAVARGVERVGGWMPADTVSRELFSVTDRVKELTMLKPLVERIHIEDRHRAAAEHFHEIDHV
jgi:predicted N-acetyltransferase YhbS